MIIVDERIGKQYAINLDISNTGITYEKIKHWLSPFFSVYLENHYYNSIKMKAVNTVEDDYKYMDGVFYINIMLSEIDLLYTIMSITRTFFKYIACSEGFVNMHAACLDYKNHGILIKAGRNQGKTTFILNSIKDKDIKLVANDQVMVRNRHILGYPAAVGIRSNRYAKQNEDKLEQVAIRYVEDPFQKHLKPVVHIKDLVQIYNSSLIHSTLLDIFIEYKKTHDENELIIKENDFINQYLEDIYLPLNQTYKNRVISDCKNALNYLRNNIEISNNKVTQDFSKIKYLDVTCGINRLDDIWKYIKENVYD